MKWHFRCPQCKGWCKADWEQRGSSIRCLSCQKGLTIPGPADQHDAYVDQHDWPTEMEVVVYSQKGTKCIISDCRDKEMTLDHIVAWDNGGKTSVSNLQPMCKSHNSSKKNQDFAAWMRENWLKPRN